MGAKKPDIENPTVLVSQHNTASPITVTSRLEYYKHSEIQDSGDSTWLEKMSVDLLIRTSPEEWQKLDEAISADPETVIENLRLIASAAVERTQKHKTPRGRRLTELRLIETIKREASHLYAFLQSYEDSEEKPPAILKLISLLESKGYGTKKYSALKYTLATMEILYKKRAQHEELLYPFRTGTNFYKTYILPHRIRHMKEYIKNNPSKIPSLQKVFRALRIPL